jgi:hypothetical protein
MVISSVGRGQAVRWPRVGRLLVDGLVGGQREERLVTIDVTASWSAASGLGSTMRHLPSTSLRSCVSARLLDADFLELVRRDGQQFGEVSVGRISRACGLLLIRPPDRAAEHSQKSDGDEETRRLHGLSPLPPGGHAEATTPSGKITMLSQNSMLSRWRSCSADGLRAPWDGWKSGPRPRTAS